MRVSPIYRIRIVHHYGTCYLARNGWTPSLYSAVGSLTTNWIHRMTSPGRTPAHLQLTSTFQRHGKHRTKSVLLSRAKSKAPSSLSFVKQTTLLPLISECVAAYVLKTCIANGVISCGDGPWGKPLRVHAGGSSETRPLA
jgi:hypothetical protein